jgi:hypothetical protein
MLDSVQVYYLLEWSRCWSLKNPPEFAPYASSDMRFVDVIDQVSLLPNAPFVQVKTFRHTYHCLSSKLFQTLAHWTRSFSALGVACGDLENLFNSRSSYVVKSLEDV